MKKKIKDTLVAITLSAFASTQVSAFCAYNKSKRVQTWYLAENEDKAKQFLAAILVSNVTGPAVEVVSLAALTAAATASTVATVGTTAPAVGVSAAATTAAVTAAKNEAPEIFKSLAETLTTGIPGAGDIIVGPTGIIGSALSEAGTKVSMGALNIRWGKKIDPGSSACWNKRDLIGESGFLGVGGKGISWVTKEDQEIFFLVLGSNNDGTASVSYADSRGVDEGISVEK